VSAKGHEAYTVLQSAIADGRYPAGARLKEVELALELGMSRTPVREAIRQLERDGMVTIAPNRGAVVRGASPDDVEDTYALRAVLEGFCASRAAVRMEPTAIAHLAEIEAALEQQIREGNDITPRIQLNAAFHEAIVEGGGNSRIIEVLQRGTAVPFAMKQAFWESPHAGESTIVYHREILEAIQAQDAMRAEAAMRTHIYGVRGFFIGRQRAADIQHLLRDA
jgi:DNA-binding GntR family transcriptional regulator